jgi:Arc/MetJ family transcription regulator
MPATLAIYTKISYIGVYPLGGSTTMGRTNIEIDDVLVEKARRLTGAKSKREAVDIALRRLVQKGSLYRALRRLRGKLAWEGDVDSWRSARTSKA